MGKGSKAAGGQRHWRQWTEEQARSALDEFAASGESAAGYARRTGVSTRRLAYWKGRLAEAGPTTFVAVALPTSAQPAVPALPHIEIDSDGVTVRVREDLDVEHLARIVDALAFARQNRRC